LTMSKEKSRTERTFSVMGMLPVCSRSSLNNITAMSIAHGWRVHLITNTILFPIYAVIHNSRSMQSMNICSMIYALCHSSCHMITHYSQSDGLGYSLPSSRCKEKNQPSTHDGTEALRDLPSINFLFGFLLAAWWWWVTRQNASWNYYRALWVWILPV
jgi:hypothetical protein